MAKTTTSQVYDSILEEIGNFGRYQIYQYFLLSLPVFFTAAYTLTFVFTAGVVQHRCLVRECGDVGSHSPFSPPWLEDAVPEKDGAPSSCYMYTPLNDTAGDTCRFDNSSEVRCHEWVYKGVEQTILNEFTLTCSENAWRLALVGTINSVGQLVGLPVCSYVSDRYGRKAALIGTLLGSFVFGVARAFSPVYEVFISLEFLEAMFTVGTYSIAFILAMELVGPRQRELGGAVIVWSYALGTAALGLFAAWLHYWRNLLLATYAPALLFVLYIWLVPESVRWLLSQGRLKDAEQVISHTAATNRVQLSEHLTAELAAWRAGNNERLAADEDEADDEDILTALKQVVKSRRLLLRVANCSFCWATNTLVYYGLSLNSVSLAGTDDIYLNFILVSLVEAPAYILAWLGMTYVGRRSTMCVSLIVSGLACFATPFISADADWAQLTLYLIGKFAITCSFDTLYVFAAEMFPTRLRTSLMGACSMVGRIGSMLAPQTPLLAYLSPLLPMTLFGVVALLAGFLALLFPETLGRSLPDSVAEAEQLGHEDSIVVSTAAVARESSPLEIQS